MKPTPTKQPIQAQAPAAPAPAVEAVAEPEVNRDLVLPRPTPELNPRNRVLADIAKRANADADAAAQESVPVTGDDGEPVAAEPAAAPEAAADAAPAEAEEPAAEAAPPVLPTVSEAPKPAGIDPNAEYEFEVDGQKVKLKGSQVLGRVQKGEAADFRLHLATKLLEEAKKQQNQAQGQPSAQADATPSAKAASAPDVDEAQLAQAIQYGTPEQAAEALRQLRKQNASTVTADGLQAFLAQQLPRMVSDQIAFSDATRFVQTEYADIMRDPYLKELFLAQEKKLRTAGDQRGYRDLYQAIGDDIRTHFKLPKPGAPAVAAPVAKPTPAAPTLEQRKEAKAAAPAAPRLAASRLEGGGAVQKPKSREDTIRWMQESRGHRPINRI